MDMTTLALAIKLSGAGSGGLPEVSAEDNGKMLQVVDGSWAAVAVSNAEEASF